MAKVTFSVRSAKGRVRNVSARPRLGQDAFREAFADASPRASPYFAIANGRCSVSPGIGADPGRPDRGHLVAAGW